MQGVYSIFFLIIMNVIIMNKCKIMSEVVELAPPPLPKLNTFLSERKSEQTHIPHVPQIPDNNTIINGGVRINT